MWKTRLLSLHRIACHPGVVVPLRPSPPLQTSNDDCKRKSKSNAEGAFWRPPTKDGGGTEKSKDETVVKLKVTYNEERTCCPFTTIPRWDACGYFEDKDSVFDSPVSSHTVDQVLVLNLKRSWSMNDCTNQMKVTLFKSSSLVGVATYGLLISVQTLGFIRYIWQLRAHVVCFEQSEE